MAVEGWKDCKFREIAFAYTGFAFKSDDFQDQGIPIIRMSNLKEGKIDLSDAKYVSENTLSKLDKFRLSAGDFLFGMSGSLSNYAVVSERDLPCYLNQRVGKLVPKSGADYSFIKQLYLSDLLQKKIDLVAAGAAQKNISSAQIEDFDVSVPPLPEQKKIAEVLESVDDAIAKTEAVIAQIERVKQGLLQQLLTRGIGHTKFKQTPLGEIPESWGLKELKDICIKVTDGSHQVVKTVDDGIPFLFVSCVRNERIIWENCGYITQEVYNEISRGRETIKGSVLYTAVGSYGHAALIEEDTLCSFQRHIAFILPNENLVLPEYLTIFLNSPLGKMQADSFAIGNAQKTVTLKSLKSFSIPLPSMAEQKRIYETVNTLRRSLNLMSNEVLMLSELKRGLMSDLLTGRVRVNVDTVPTTKTEVAA